MQVASNECTALPLSLLFLSFLCECESESLGERWSARVSAWYTFPLFHVCSMIVSVLFVLSLPPTQAGAKLLLPARGSSFDQEAGIPATSLSRLRLPSREHSFTRAHRAILAVDLISLSLSLLLLSLETTMLTISQELLQQTSSEA